MAASGNIAKYTLLQQYHQYNGVLVYNGIFHWSFLYELSLT